MQTKNSFSFFIALALVGSAVSGCSGGIDESGAASDEAAKTVDDGQPKEIVSCTEVSEFHAPAHAVTFNLSAVRGKKGLALIGGYGLSESLKARVTSAKNSTLGWVLTVEGDTGLPGPNVGVREAISSVVLNKAGTVRVEFKKKGMAPWTYDTCHTSNLELIDTGLNRGGTVWYEPGPRESIQPLPPLRR